jgi:GNAT superfamily N-acetyltransferase
MKIRKAEMKDASEIARVNIETWLTTYRGLLPDKLLDNLSHEEREQFYKGMINSINHKKFIHVAEAETDGIVGYIFGGLERSGETFYKGEIYAFYVLEAFQQQGIGKQLWQAALDSFKELNIDSLLLWALAGNKYVQFYEKLSGKEIEKKTFNLGEFTMEGVAYGWHLPI